MNINHLAGNQSLTASSTSIPARNSSLDSNQNKGVLLLAKHQHECGMDTCLYQINRRTPLYIAYVDNQIKYYYPVCAILAANVGIMKYDSSIISSRLITVKRSMQESGVSAALEPLGYQYTEYD